MNGDGGSRRLGGGVGGRTRRLWWEGEDSLGAVGYGQGSHHILLDLTVRHRDAQRSLSWGEGRGTGEGTPG